MRISRLGVKNYRNLEENSFDFNDKINYIYGDNAQGKTNLIESIWMLTGARSFRGTKDNNIVSFEAETAKIDGKLFFEQRDQSISIFFANGRRRVFLNDIPRTYPTEIIGKFRAVLFTPSHLALVKDGPESRRKFIDAALCQLTPTYPQLMVKYNQTLKHRNILLKNSQMQNIKSGLFEVWNYKLAELGSKIIKKRLEYLSRLEREALINYCEISSGKESLKISYISSIFKGDPSTKSEAEIEKEFLHYLNCEQKRDEKRGFTSKGPHKDDLEIFLQGKSLKQFGSQGQQRSAVLALKLAEATVMNQLTGESPVVLLDDVMSELDETRKNYMIESLENWQTFITGCEKNLVSSFENLKFFHIANGSLVE